MTANKYRVCPLERAGGLDNRIRRWLQNPRKILSPYVQEGMTVLDCGYGPGFFTMDMAQMVGQSGRVIAADLQEGMLQKLKDKIHGTGFEKRVIPHLCRQNKIGWQGWIDLILAFYVVHEIPDQKGFFKEALSMLRRGGRILVVEPPFHVSAKAFAKTLENARDTGFKTQPGPKMFFSKTAILQKTEKA